MRTIVLSLLFSGILLPTIFAQKEITYVNPPAVLGDGYTLEVDDIISNESACKLRMVIKNLNTDAFLVYRLQNSGFEFDKLGKYYEKKQKGEVIAPLKKDGIVVKVVGNDYRHPSFTFHPEGLFMASFHVDPIHPTAFELKPGATDKFNSQGVIVSLVNVVDKKGIMNVTLEVSLSSSMKNELLILDPNQLQLVNAEGQLVESDLKRNKVVGLQAGESKKISFTYPSSESVTIKWNHTIKVSPLIAVPVEEIPIVDQSKPVAKRNEVSCPPFTGKQQGSVNVVIQGGSGVCFKLDINGFPVVTEFASAASFSVNPGRQKMLFTFPDGTVAEESSIINNWYSSVGFNVVKKKNGSYAVRYDVFAQVLSPEGEQQRSAMMTKVTTSTSVNRTNTQSASTSNTSNSSNAGGSCFGAPSSGATSVKIKVTWKGNPVANHAIRIKQGGTVLGVGSTDGSGLAKISTNSFNNPQIDVEGCSGSNSWSVSGSFCVLDSSGYLELPLDVIAREMANLLGLSLEEIGSSWGF